MFRQNEDAVSPVIGVILMVAITVILAAVIAMFVFGMANDIETTKTVGVTAKLSGDNAVLTFQGGPDANKVNAIYATLFEGSTATARNESEQFSSTAVGSVHVISGAESNDRILVTAKFDDGTTQVLLDRTL